MSYNIKIKLMDNENKEDWEIINNLAELLKRKTKPSYLSTYSLYLN